MESMRETLGGIYHAENKNKASLDLLEDKRQIYERVGEESRDHLSGRLPTKEAEDCLLEEKDH